MTEEQINKQLVFRRGELKRKILAMEWDKKRDQMNLSLNRNLENYKKELEISGVGFKAAVQGKVLNLSLSFSHPINYAIPEGVTVETPKPTIIVIKGADKAKVGEVAAEIRDYYRPEPYKGKGIKYAGEQVRRKAGKAVAGAGSGGK